MEHAVTRNDILERVPRHGDGINWHALAFVDRYSPDQAKYAERVLARRRPQVLAHRGKPAMTGFGGKLAFGHNVYNGALRQAMEKFTGEPEDGTGEAAGNLLTTMGLTTMTSLLIGVTPSGALYPMDTTHSVCGVGATSTAANIADVALGANAGSAWYQAMDSANPTVALGVITGITTYASADGNFAWNEWAWASGTGTRTASATFASVYGTAASRSLWNHKIPASSLGTKASGAAWVFLPRYHHNLLEAFVRKVI